MLLGIIMGAGHRYIPDETNLAFDYVKIAAPIVMFLGLILALVGKLASAASEVAGMAEIPDEIAPVSSRVASRPGHRDTP